jgi:hypothetical protein
MIGGGPSQVICRQVYGIPSFWKGLLWAVNIVKMGYKWRVEMDQNLGFGRTNDL